MRSMLTSRSRCRVIDAECSEARRSLGRRPDQAAARPPAAPSSASELTSNVGWAGGINPAGESGRKVEQGSESSRAQSIRQPK
jgi:hypothetical protein